MEMFVELGRRVGLNVRLSPWPHFPIVFTRISSRTQKSGVSHGHRQRKTNLVRCSVKAQDLDQIDLYLRLSMPCGAR
jgi:hypothetical protein